MNRISDILLKSDVTLASFLLGWGLIAWGLVAVFMSPIDLISFEHATKSLTWGFWLFNYITVGVLYVYLAIDRFPTTLSLLTGAYSIIMWSWIASFRGGIANYTAGTILNLIVIVMGCILLQRSQVK